MTGLGKGLLLTACGLVVAGVASAAVPNRANSSFPASGITITGRNAANSPQEDAIGAFTVTVRDINNTVINGATVAVNFAGCTPDIRVSSVQSFTGLTVTCPTKVVSATTNALGVATFRILGGAVNSGNSPGATFDCGVISANGVFLNNVTVAVIDQTGNLNGALANDVSVVVSDILNGATVGRSDFTFNDALQANDLALMAGYVLSNRSAQNTGTACP